MLLVEDKIMPARVKITMSDKEIKAGLIFAAKEVISDAILKASPRAIAKIRALVGSKILNSSTFSSLLDGVLRLDFGLTNEMATSATAAIISQVIKNIDAVYNLRNNLSVGSVTISLLPVNIEEIANIPQGTYISENANGEFNEVGWLRWLLLHGSEFVVDDHRVQYVKNHRSRSGGALMKPDGVFRVDPSFSGTENDNFLTREIEGVRNEIIEIIRMELIGAL